MRINHEGEVNRARYMPQNKFVVATKSPSSNVYIFDVSKHPSAPKNNTFRPELTLLGHDAEGYGLNWSPLIPGHLLSGSDDCKVCLWDTNEKPDATNRLKAKSIFTGHTSIVEGRK